MYVMAPDAKHLIIVLYCNYKLRLRLHSMQFHFVGNWLRSHDDVEGWRDNSCNSKSPID